MADLTNAPILTAYATYGSRLSDLAIRDGQLIYVQDKHKIALDFGGKRTFYNQFEELATDGARTSMLAPVAGLFYFVVETAVLWTYRDGWVQITTPPREVVFIGTELPELGAANTLYVDPVRKEISVWDSETSGYTVVANKTEPSVIPTTSSSDNGKFLRVVNGTPAWQEIPRAEEATF